jgi:hypothetical protein
MQKHISRRTAENDLGSVFIDIVLRSDPKKLDTLAVDVDGGSTTSGTESGTTDVGKT